MAAQMLLFLLHLDSYNLLYLSNVMSELTEEQMKFEKLTSSYMEFTLICSKICSQC